HRSGDDCDARKQLAADALLVRQRDRCCPRSGPGVAFRPQLSRVRIARGRRSSRCFGGPATWRWPLILAVVLLSLTCARPAVAYSVLSHEALVDALWDEVVVALLRQKFPAATPDQITDARAYAYGGSVIQDLGYYPFGS